MERFTCNLLDKQNTTCVVISSRSGGCSLFAIENKQHIMVANGICKSLRDAKSFVFNFETKT